MDDESRKKVQKNDVRQHADAHDHASEHQASSSASNAASDLSGEVASTVESNEEPLPKRPKIGLRPLDTSATHDKDKDKRHEPSLGEPSKPTARDHVLTAKATILGLARDVQEAMQQSSKERCPALKTAHCSKDRIERHKSSLGEPRKPTARDHVLAAKATLLGLARDVQAAMPQSSKERWPALKTAPGYSSNLYDAILRYSPENNAYTVQIFPPKDRRDDAGNDDGDNDGQDRAANVPMMPPRPPPQELETPDANEAVNFLLDYMKQPKLFDLHCVRGKDVVAALQSRDDKKLIVEHALGIEYYEGIEATSPQALIECMDQVESVLLRNQPGTQATLIKQYLDNSLLKLCLSKNISRIWMPTVSCPQITEDAMIDFCFGGDSVSHIFQERKLHIYGPGVTPNFFEKLVEISTSSSRAQIVELRAWRVNLNRQHTEKYASRKKKLQYSNDQSENGWYYDFTDNAIPFQIAFNPERNQRCITLRRGPKDMVGKDWFYGPASSALKPLAFF